MEHAIFLTFDDAYFRYAKTCLLSLDQNYPDHPVILAMYDGSDPDIVQFLHSIRSLKIIHPERGALNLDSFKPGLVASPKVFNRYILWTDTFSEYDNILHLDVDTLVLRPLDALFEKKDFFAVHDYTPFGFTLFKREHYQDETLAKQLQKDRIALPIPEIKMMNAGVFIIPARYRRQACFDELYALTETYNAYTSFADQAAISLWCMKNNITFSDEIRFNFQLPFLGNTNMFYDESIQKNFSTDAVLIAHFTWWKENVYYKRFLEYADFMRNIESFMQHN